jgi:hypothetical protein
MSVSLRMFLASSYKTCCSCEQFSALLHVVPIAAHCKSTFSMILQICGASSHEHKLGTVLKLGFQYCVAGSELLCTVIQRSSLRGIVRMLLLH